jgi:hypothetical protein
MNKDLLCLAEEGNEGDIVQLHLEGGGLFVAYYAGFDNKEIPYLLFRDSIGYGQDYGHFHRVSINSRMFPSGLIKPVIGYEIVRKRISEST